MPDVSACCAGLGYHIRQPTRTVTATLLQTFPGHRPCQEPASAARAYTKPFEAA